MAVVINIIRQSDVAHAAFALAVAVVIAIVKSVGGA